jgi:predicted Zn-dependent protease
MSKLHWNIEQLKAHLAQRKEVKAWIVTEEHVHRRERYFMNEKSELVTDQDRNVHSRNISLRLFVYLPKKGRQGEMTKKLFPSLSLKNQIDAAIEAALQTDHQTWNLPTEFSKTYPHLTTTDPRMAEDLDRVMIDMTAQIQKAVTQKRGTEFNSAELFLSVHDRELHLSNGLNHRSSQSRIYTEAAYSYSKTLPNHEVLSDEFLSSNWAVNLDHLPIEKIFNDTSDHAKSSLDVIKPTTGKYSVIVDAEVLSVLLHGQLSQLTAANSYHGLPFIKPGQEFIVGAHGDTLSITLDPSLEYGANTVAVSEQGLPQLPLQLVSQNRVMATATDKQYGDYLGLPPSTVRGNVVVEPGKLSHRELTQHAPMVIEILQFSGLFADANSGTFSSEIRLARLYDNKKGTVCYLKGGSLSGSIVENFKKMRLSKSTTHRAHFSTDSTYGQGYLGPDFALLGDVSIVG